MGEVCIFMSGCIEEDDNLESARYRRLKASDEMLLRNIAGEHILIPVGEAALKLHGMISLSESGLLLWNKLQEESSEEELIEAVLEEYDIDHETASADVQEFLNRLCELELLEGAET